MRCVLFTPVGGHDPIASYRDGAVLHICRVYRPEKVYLYLSHEMLERSRQDDRYRASLMKLQEHLHYQIKEIKMIERDELTQVQLFDAFYTDFDQILRQIHAENPDCELLLNLSSGTPAMKSALNVISVLAPYAMRAIQVSTPHKRENPKDEAPEDYDVEAAWACNEDNTENFFDRCREVEIDHLLVKIKKESIERLLEAYNYEAALMMAQDIAEFVPERAMQMLHAAECRLQLDQRGYDKALQGLECRFMPVENGEHRQIFEYVLSLQIKLAQGNYADFLRGLTPVVIDLFEICLKNQLHITVEQYCERNRSGVWMVRRQVMQKSETGQKILRAMEKRADNQELKEGPLSSMNILWIFQEFSDNDKLLDDLKSMREIESKVRNIAAHEIVSVTNSWIKSRTEMTGEDIMKLLKRLVAHAGIRAKTEYWNSYDDMNAAIAAELLLK